MMRSFWRRRWRDLCRSLTLRAGRPQGPSWHAFRRILASGHLEKIEAGLGYKLHEEATL